MTPSITIYRGFPATNAYPWSPFALKLEARLRFARVPYLLGVGSPREAPRGKIPYVSISGDSGSGSPPVGEPQGDSTLVIRRLVHDGVLPDINDAARRTMGPARVAHDLAVRALLEDKLYFYQVRERWFDNYHTMRAGVMGRLPYPVQVVVGALAYRGVARTLFGQGTGRLTADEKAALQSEVWAAVCDLLVEARSSSSSGGKSDDKPSKTTTPAAGAAAGDTDTASPFWLLGGSGPTEADATLFGFIASSLVCAA